MPTKDPRVDAYIAKAANFARPILAHIRKLVHTAAPEVVETMKWSMPHFEHKAVICGMAALKKTRRPWLPFENFSYSHRKDYVEWITEAKREETRAKRIVTALEWLATGKSRNWKHERC
jgi:hypothetical protein